MRQTDELDEVDLLVWWCFECNQSVPEPAPHQRCPDCDGPLRRINCLE